VKQKKEARISAEIESEEASRMRINMRTYNSWDLGANIDFAHHG